MRKGCCPKCEDIVMIGNVSGLIGNVSETTLLHCDQCNEDFLLSEWLQKADDVNERVKEEQLKTMLLKKSEKELLYEIAKVTARQTSILNRIQFFIAFLASWSLLLGIAVIVFVLLGGFTISFR